MFCINALCHISMATFGGRIFSFSSSTLSFAPQSFQSVSLCWLMLAFVYMYFAILTCLSMQQLYLGWIHTAEQDSQAQRQVEQTQSECREIKRSQSTMLLIESVLYTCWLSCCIHCLFPMHDWKSSVYIENNVSILLLDNKSSLKLGWRTKKLWKEWRLTHMH